MVVLTQLMQSLSEKVIEQAHTPMPALTTRLLHRHACPFQLASWVILMLWKQESLSQGMEEDILAKRPMAPSVRKDTGGKEEDRKRPGRG